jgi:hypothetical protein
MELKNFNKLIKDLEKECSYTSHEVTDKDGGSEVYEIPGYDGTIAGYCAKYIRGEEPKVKKNFKLK